MLQDRGIQLGLSTMYAVPAEHNHRRPGEDSQYWSHTIHKARDHASATGKQPPWMTSKLRNTEQMKRECYIVHDCLTFSFTIVQKLQDDNRVMIAEADGKVHLV